MKALIFCGGSIEDYEVVRAELDADFIICADGGAGHLKKFGVLPHYLVGDFDSLSEGELNYYIQNNVSIDKYPKEKDYTDAEIAVEKAAALGAEEIVITGASGGRMDHAISIIFLLKKILDLGKFGRIISGMDEIFLAKEFFSIKGSKDDKLTLLPFDKQVTGITTEGLIYKLTDETLQQGSTRGVSNQFSDEIAQIFIKNGLLLVIKSKER